MDRGGGYAEQCLGKEPFQSGHLAWRVAKRRYKAGYVSDVYRCSICRQFHIGTPTKTRFKRRRRL